MLRSAAILRLARAGLVVLMGASSGCSGGSGAAPAGGGGGGGGGSVPPVLKFAAQPTDGLADRPWRAAVRVSAVAGTGKPLDPADRVAIRLEGAPATWLHGTLTRPLVSGVATFDDLSIERAGRDLILVATLVRKGATLATVRSTPFRRGVRARRNLILMIADGWGYQQIAAARSFTGRAGAYAPLSSVPMTTWDENVKLVNGTPPYDPKLAWTDLVYLIRAVTDSASAATAMYTGQKTSTGQISIGPGTNGARLQTIAELARRNALGVGAVTSVPISHATPAAWVAHNEFRDNYRTIADEMLFGDPAATGASIGGRGPSPLLPHVLIGGGHPATFGNGLISLLQLERAALTGWTVIDRYGFSRERYGPASTRLREAAAVADRLFGLFGSSTGNIAMRKHDGSGLDPDEPTLAEMASAALINLSRHPDGLCLMIEGGAVDWAGHANDMSLMLGEMIGFDEAVTEVIGWIDDPNNGSDWNNTLLIVTGDHETGLLTAGPGIFPDKPLGEVTDARIRAEMIDANSGLKASWDDVNKNGQIDALEEVYWTWHTIGHANILIPCYFKGLGSDRFAKERVDTDPVRGDYIDNTALYRIMLDALGR